MLARRIILAGVACFFLISLSVGYAAESIPPEWLVGQDKVTEQLLRVIPPTEAPAELSLKEAVEVAFQRNVDFRGIILGLLSARSNYAVAQQLWQLNLTGSLTRSNGEPSTTASSVGGALSYSAVTGANISVASELSRLDSEEMSSGTSVSLSQPLLAGGGKASSAYESLRSARNAYRRALIGFFTSRQNFIADIIGQYFGVTRQQQVVGIQADSVKRAEQTVKDAQVRLNEGLITEIELTSAQSSLSNAQTQAVLAQQAAQDSLDRLLLALGLRIGGNPKLVTTVSYVPTTIDAEAAVNQALMRSPRLRLDELSREDEEAALRISRNSLLPNLDLSATQELNDGGANRNWSIGLQLAVPIASRARNESARQAKWAFLIAQQRRENFKQQIILDVRAQVNAANAAKANVDNALKGRDFAKRSVEIAKRMIEEGLGTNRELLTAQDSLTASEISLAESKINYYFATVALRQSMGIDISTDLPDERIDTPEAAK